MGRRRRIPISAPRSGAAPRSSCLSSFAAILPLVLSDYNLYLATQVAIYAIATLGLDIVFGRNRQLSLSHASFFGLGAYGAALMAAWTWPWWAQIPIVVAVATTAGAVVAVPTLRLAGLRLALVTLLFGELFIWAINHAGEVTGGSQGLAVPPLVIGRFSSAVPVWAYTLCMLVAAAATLLTVQMSAEPKMPPVAADPLIGISAPSRITELVTPTVFSLGSHSVAPAAPANETAITDKRWAGFKTDDARMITPSTLKSAGRLSHHAADVLVRGRLEADA